ncbi:AMP-binding protein [Streptomyces sp. 8N706]|uniref:AMP-binding protein n=1 Tax=Streptomyces sp. 8N706 TaxID=3457416 RepID=UPI003FD68CDE
MNGPNGQAQWQGQERSITALKLPEFFEAQVRLTPDVPAVSFRDTHLTYRELNERANRLARLLVAHGAGSETYVAVAVPRSEQLVEAWPADICTGPR